jgi:hypothetical protein
MLHRLLVSFLLLSSACTPFGETKTEDGKPDDVPGHATEAPTTSATAPPPPTTTATPSADNRVTSIRLDGLEANISITDGADFSFGLQGGGGSIQKSTNGTELAISGTPLPGSAPTITITMPVFAGFVMNGSGTVIVNKTTAGSDVTLQITEAGNGSVQFSGAAKSLIADLRGQGEIVLSGSATSTSASCAGTGTISGSGYTTGVLATSHGVNGQITL